MVDFGSRLKATRKARKITQKDLAKELKIAQSTIANYENNLRFPGSDILRSLSDYLDVSIDYLLGLDTPKDDLKLPTEFDFKDLYVEIIDILLKGDIKQATKIIKNINSSGIETTKIIEKLFIPALELLKSKRLLNELSIAEECHIIGMIENLFYFVSESNEVEVDKELTVLFMAPPSEEYLINLTMATEYFKLRGWKMKFIGKSIPKENLLQIIQKDKIDLIVISSMTQMSLNSASYFVAAIRSSLKEKTPIILLEGASANSSNMDLISTFADYQVETLDKLDAYIDLIENKVLK